MVDRAYIASSCGRWCRIESTRWGAGGRACQGPEMELDRASQAAPRLRVFAAARLFSTGGAAFKLCGFTGWQVAGLRGAVAAIAVLVMVPEARRAWTWRAALVGVAYAVTTILFVQANKLTTAADAVFLEDASPLCILVLGPWLLREPVQPGDGALLLVRALQVSLLLLLEPVLNPIWAWLIHGETPSAWSLAGGALILGAIVVRILAQGRETRVGVAA